MKWKESYSVGVPVLDADHRILLGIINRVGEAKRTGESVKSLLKEIEDYALDHFQREEDRMRAVDYPRLAEHVKEHRGFMKWLDSVITTYHTTPDADLEIAHTVDKYLQTWWDKHLLTLDVAYKDYLA
jgi:hemerythrin-like metal-binding protein